jgi:hypothetical protein
MRLLVEQARRLLADNARRELDLGITPKAVKVEIVGPPAETLFTESSAAPFREPNDGLRHPCAPHQSNSVAAADDYLASADGGRSRRTERGGV